MAGRTSRNDTWFYKLQPDLGLKPKLDEWKFLDHGENPEKRLKSSLTAVVGSKYSAILFGGSDMTKMGEVFYNDVWGLLTKPEVRWQRIDKSSNTDRWPVGRRAHTAVSMGSDAIVIFGGKSSHGDVLGDTWVYHVTKNTFEYLGDIPGKRMSRKGHSAICYSDRYGTHMVIYGGRRNSKVYLSDVWRLTRDKNSVWKWKKLADE